MRKPSTEGVPVFCTVRNLTSALFAPSTEPAVPFSEDTVLVMVVYGGEGVEERLAVLGVGANGAHYDRTLVGGEGAGVLPVQPVGVEVVYLRLGVDGHGRLAGLHVEVEGGKWTSENKPSTHSGEYPLVCKLGEHRTSCASTRDKAGRVGPYGRLGSAVGVLGVVRWVGRLGRWRPFYLARSGRMGPSGDVLVHGELPLRR